MTSVGLSLFNYQDDARSNKHKVFNCFSVLPENQFRNSKMKLAFPSVPTPFCTFLFYLSEAYIIISRVPSTCYLLSKRQWSRSSNAFIITKRSVAILLQPQALLYRRRLIFLRSTDNLLLITTQSSLFPATYIFPF